MRPKIVLALAAAILSGACALRAQRHPPTADWSAVLALSADEQIEVLMLDGRRIPGTVQSVDAERMVVGPASVSLHRTDVREIWEVPREDSLLNGYAVGSIGGLVVGGLARADGNAGFVLAALTTAIGAVAGGWIDRGWNGPPRRLVYRRGK